MGKDSESLGKPEGENGVFPRRILPRRILSYGKIVKAECKPEGENGVFPRRILPRRILSYGKIGKKPGAKWRGKGICLGVVFSRSRGLGKTSAEEKKRREDPVCSEILPLHPKHL